MSRKPPSRSAKKQVAYRVPSSSRMVVEMRKTLNGISKGIQVMASIATVYEFRTIDDDKPRDIVSYYLTDSFARASRVVSNLCDSASETYRLINETDPLKMVLVERLIHQLHTKLQTQQQFLRFLEQH